jgi:hypothetical protein
MFCTSLARQFDPARATVAALPHPAYSARLRTTSHVDPQRGGYRKYFKQAATHLSASNLELVHSPLAAGGKCFLAERRVINVVCAAKRVRKDANGNDIEEDVDASPMEDIGTCAADLNDEVNENDYKIGVNQVDHDFDEVLEEEELNVVAASTLRGVESAPASLTTQHRLPRPMQNSSSMRGAVAPSAIAGENVFDPIMIGAGVVALASVGFLAFQKQRKTRQAKDTVPDASQIVRPPDSGFSIGQLDGIRTDSSGRGLDEDLPVGNFSFEGLPVISDDAASFNTPPPREIHGAFKRQLRDMMSEMRRYTTIDLHGRNLGDTGSAYISEALAFNDIVSCIDLSANGIGEAGVIAICDALKSNSALEMLSLASNNLQDVGVVALAEYLQTDSSINTLNLNSCGIGDIGASALAEMLKKNTSIVALELNNNNIDYEGTCAIAEALSGNASLETLSISGNYIGGLGASALANGLLKNTGIKGLIINGNDIGNIGMIHFLTRLLAFMFRYPSSRQCLCYED